MPDGGSHWFEPKSHGYGASPVTWQGWALIMASVAVALAITWFAFWRPGVAGSAPDGVSIAI